MPKLLLLFAFSSLLATASCKKKEEPECATNQMELSINGTPWQADKVTGFKANQFSIAAEGVSGQLARIEFGLPGDAGVGDFNLARVPGVNEYGAVVYPRSGGQEYSASGTLRISTHDTAQRLMIGTFDFVTYTGDQFSGGSFCLKY